MGERMSSEGRRLHTGGKVVGASHGNGVGTKGGRSHISLIVNCSEYQI